MNIGEKYFRNYTWMNEFFKFDRGFVQTRFEEIITKWIIFFSRIDKSEISFEKQNRFKFLLFYFFEKKPEIINRKTRY